MQPRRTNDGLSRARTGGGEKVSFVHDGLSEATTTTATTTTAAAVAATP